LMRMEMIPANMAEDDLEAGEIDLMWIWIIWKQDFGHIPRIIFIWKNDLLFFVQEISSLSSLGDGIFH
jgi:hypothetical protein